MESVLPYVLAIVPTVGVGTLFYFVIKTILEGDRRERLAQAQWEAQHDRRGGAERPAPDASGPATTDSPVSGTTTPAAPGKER